MAMLDSSGLLHRLDNDGATRWAWRQTSQQPRPPSASALAACGFGGSEWVAAADADARNLLVLLHGLGDEPEPFAKFARQMALPQTAALALRAPLPLPAGIEVGRAWFDSFEADGALIAPKSGERRRVRSLEQTVSKLRALVALLRSSGWAHERIFLLGFAQGGTAALAYALRSEHRLGGVASVCGHVLPESEDRAAAPAARQTPMLVLAGERDAQTPAADARRLFDRLKTRVVDARPADGGAAAAELGAAALRTLRCAMPRSRDGRAFGRMHIRKPQPMKNRRMTPPTTMPAIIPALPPPPSSGEASALGSSGGGPSGGSGGGDGGGVNGGEEGGGTQ